MLIFLAMLVSTKREHEHHILHSFLMTADNIHRKGYVYVDAEKMRLTVKVSMLLQALYIVISIMIVDLSIIQLLEVRGLKDFHSLVSNCPCFEIGGA